MTKDISTLLGALTLEEKAALCSGINPWQTSAIERLDIPSMTVSDGPHGVRRVSELDSIMKPSLPATCFPTASALAATWNPALVEEMGQALADECITLGVDVLLGPGNNMKRTPLCGRNFEYYSEDPFLGGELATGFIKGVQSKGVGTSLKHFAANNQEYRRFSINAVVDERALREIYLAGFERAVKQAKPWTVMCAYNRLNGDYCSQHDWLMNKILKEEWGFEGLVVSDWGAVHDAVAAVAGGLDLEMPGPQPASVESIVRAVKNGELDEAALDAAVERLLRIVLRTAETPKGSIEIDVEAHHALARRIAGEAIVLLKNEGNLLPLTGQEKLAVIGQSAQEPYFQGGGSSHINPTKVDMPLKELKDLSDRAEVRFAPGYTLRQEFKQELIDEAVDVAREADVALLFIALPGYKESEGYDRPDIDLTEQQVALIRAVTAVQPKTVVILNNGSPVAMSNWIDSTAAVLEAWMMGQAGGGAIADVLFGRVNPSGKLAETFPVALKDTPAYLNYPGENGEVRYGEGLFIGYRYYDLMEQEVLFPFGHGLSYTTFAYGNLRLSAEKFKDVEGLTVSVDVTNTGGVAGKEIVQVYVHDQKSKLRRPYKELKGFAKVALDPGETKTVEIALDLRAFAYYHPAYGQWITETGKFDILVGSSARDIHLQATAHMSSTQSLPCILHRESTMGEWMDDPQGIVVMSQVMQQLQEASGQSEEEDLGMEQMNLMKEMPLATVFRFFGDGLPMSPREMVDNLLAQVREVEE